MKLSPGTARQLAEGSVTFVRQKFGFELLYTPESLLFVDAVVDKIRETGATEAQASGLLSGLGCYAGEVFVRNAKASWRAPADLGMRRSCRFPVILALPGPIPCDPLERVFQRFSGATTDGVAGLFDAVVLSAKTAPAPPQA
jgi:hypothetical protein